MPWKQIIGCEISYSSVSPSKKEICLKKYISRVEECGLYIVPLTLDMGNTNVVLWSKLNISAQKNGFPNNLVLFNNYPIYVMLDVCHLLKI